MKMSKCPDSIAIKYFQKGIKRDFGLFIKLTKTSSHSLYMVYKEAQKLLMWKKS